MNEEIKIEARVAHKHKTEAEWYLEVYIAADSTIKRSNPFIPLNGELIIFDADENHERRFKFGDGKTDAIALPFVSSGASTAISTTYAELKQLRDKKRLNPGTFYRITDYQCTTTQENTRAMNNQFDIIVQALSESTLSEQARADYHYNNGEISDGYFIKKISDFKLNSQYMMYEDEQGVESTPDPEYKWNDVFIAYGYKENQDGIVVPVLYKTDIRDYPNEADYEDTFYYVGQYEFEGEVYDKWQKIEESNTDSGEEKRYVLTEVIVENNQFIESAMESNAAFVVIANIPAWELKYCFDNDINRFAWADSAEGKGVIYHMRDEHGNECPYDFKNIQFLRSATWHQQHPECFDYLLETFKGDAYYYTFSWITEDDDIVDLTMQQLTDSEEMGRIVNNNVLKECEDIAFTSPRRVLADNVFIDSSDFDMGDFAGIYNNTIDLSCRMNTLIGHCINNKLCYGCFENILINSNNNYLNRGVSEQLLNSIDDTEYL